MNKKSIEKIYFQELNEIINDIPVKENLICLEGVSGSGKSTIGNLLKKNRNYNYLLGIPKEMNSFEIKKKMICNVNYISSAMYFLAGNLEIAYEVKNKTIDNNIVLDRFFLSTFAVNYKNCKSIDELIKQNIILKFLDNIKKELIFPQITFVLKVAKEKCLERIKSKNKDKNKILETYFDNQEIDNLDKEYAFWEHLRNINKRIIIIETDNHNPSEVEKLIYNEINHF